MRKSLQSVLTVSGSTLGSRILGLFRDILVYAQLGLSQTNSAFILAFTLPNLFRRLFGEGALSSALIPVFTGERMRDGDAAGFQLLNRTLSRLLLVLLALCLLFGAIVGVLLFSGMVDQTRYGEAARLSLLLFPYVIPICLAALIAGALQVLGRFFTPAATPMLLNVCMIAFLGGPGLWFGNSPAEKAVWLSIGVLVGGIIQFLLPAADLYRRGWRPKFDPSLDAAMEKLQSLFVPALAGAAILQVNILVSRTLAFFIDDDGVALLYLAARLVELPLGIFAIAATTVLFPQFARFAGAGNNEGLRRSYRLGSAFVFAVTLPAFIGLAVLGNTILQAVFAWGLFDPADAARAAPVLAIFAAGLPFYAQSALLTRAHQARQDMTTPVRVAGWVLLSNLLLSIALMIPFGVHGLAAANSLAAVVQVILLQWHLRSKIADGKPWIPLETFKVVAAAAILLSFLLLLPSTERGADRTDLLLRLLWVVPSGALLVASILALLRFSPLIDLFSSLRNRFQHKMPDGDQRTEDNHDP